MPRKTRKVNSVCAPGWEDFNEAAARCRGKPHNISLGTFDGFLTSMRPRPDAAENRTSCDTRSGSQCRLQ